MDNLSFWASELQGTRLPDKRYSGNLIQMCSRLSTHCGQSFSSACGPAIRKSANRLFSREDVQIQSGHLQQTIDRCKSEPYVLVLEDSTDLYYGGHKQTEGLGDLGGGFVPTLGISVHTALAVNSQKEPLGIIGQHIWAPVNEHRKSPLLKKLKIEQKESYKWLRVLQWVNEYLEDYAGQVVVVGDREGDFYEHFSAVRNSNLDLVIRLLHRHRKVIWQDKELTVNELLEELPYAGDYSVAIPAQKGRKERVASLSIFHTPIICPVPQERTGEKVPMYLVWAIEIDELPEGVDPLEWIILTTLPTDNLQDACAILDTYSMRWIIERFHYVLKQGLRVERLQFDNFTRLANATKLCSMVAWQLLRVAYLSKAKELDKAENHFDSKEKMVLEKVTGSTIDTVKDYILALGKLVGFVSSKKQRYPGEKLLWQAIQQFNAIKTGFLLAQSYGTG